MVGISEQSVSVHPYRKRLGECFKSSEADTLTPSDKGKLVGVGRAWKQCTACDLHKTAKKHTTYRGTVPCDVLFIGEAPGEVENVIGQPFVGPSGKLLDQIIKDAAVEANLDYSFAICNVVACMPWNDNAERVRPPKPAEAKACAPNINRLIAFARPRFVVFVGQTALRSQPLYTFGPRMIATEAIEHPASILRKDKSQEYETAYFRAVMKISNMIAVPF